LIDCFLFLLHLTLSSHLRSHARNTHTHTHTYPAHIQLCTGDILTIITKHDNGWWEGTLDKTGLFGFFPATYVEELGVSDSQSVPSTREHRDSIVDGPTFDTQNQPAVQQQVQIQMLPAQGHGVPVSSSAVNIDTDDQGWNQNPLYTQPQAQPQPRSTVTTIAPMDIASGTSEPETYEGNRKKTVYGDISRPFGGANPWSPVQLWRKSTKRDRIIFIAVLLLVLGGAITATVFLLPEDGLSEGELKAAANAQLDSTAASMVNPSSNSFTLDAAAFPARAERVEAILESLNINSKSLQMNLGKQMNVTDTFINDYTPPIRKLFRRVDNLEGVPMRLFSASAPLFGTTVNVTVMLYVPVLTDPPLVEIALKIELPSAWELVDELPMASALTWLKDTEIVDGGELIVSTGPLETLSRFLAKGVNIDVDLTLTPEQSSFLYKFQQVIVPHSNNLPIRLRAKGHLPLLPDVVLPPPSTVDPDQKNLTLYNDEGYFDVMAENAGFRFGKVAVDVDKIALSINGLGVRKAPDVSVFAQTTVTFQDNSISSRMLGEWKPGQGMTWDGEAYAISLPKIEPHLAIQSLTASLIVDQTVGTTFRFREFTFSADATITAWNDQPVSVKGIVSPRYTAVLATAPLANIVTLDDALCKFANQCDKVPFVGELGLGQLTFYFSVATAKGPIDGVMLKEGVSLFADASIVVPSDLEAVFELFNIDDARVYVGANMPFNVPKDFTIFLSLQNVPGPGSSDVVDSTQVTFNSLSVEVKPIQSPPTIGIVTVLTVTGLASDPLVFEVSALFAGSNLVLIGSMDGTWDDVAGIKGLSLTDATLSLGIGPGPTGVSITEFGVAANVTFGEQSVEFAVLISPARNKYAISASTQNLNLGDIVSFVEEASGVDLSIAGDIVDNLGIIDLRNLDFQAAPENIQFGNTLIRQGLKIDCDASILGLDVQVDVGMIEREITLLGFPVPVNDFVIGFGLHNIALSDFIPGLGLGAFAADAIERRIEDFRELCVDLIAGKVCKKVPIPDISGVVSKITEGLDNFLTIHQISLDEFSLVNALYGAANKNDINTPMFVFNATILDDDYYFEQKVSLDFLADKGGSAAKFIWNNVLSRIPSFLDTVRDKAIGLFCNLVRKLCVDIEVTKVCIKVPSICD
jgi:Variant SH3 domain